MTRVAVLILVLLFQQGCAVGLAVMSVVTTVYQERSRNDLEKRIEELEKK
jgi:hypothetical protein